MIKIKAVNNRTLDVFFGEDSWYEDEWARFSITKTNNQPYLKQIAGAPMPKHLFAALLKTVRG